MKATLQAIIMAGVLAIGAHAEHVYMSAHGKTFHKSQECSMLRRASVVYSADEGEAKEHGLHQCGVCFREHKAGTAGAASWAKETKRKESK
jgi:hypothetical protein